MNIEPKQILNNEKKSSRNKEGKQWKNLERHENVRGKMKVGDKNKVEGLVEKWLVFFK